MLHLDRFILHVRVQIVKVAYYPQRDMINGYISAYMRVQRAAKGSFKSSDLRTCESTALMTSDDVDAGL